MYVFMYEYMYVCVHVCMYVCMYFICKYVCIQQHTIVGKSLTKQFLTKVSVLGRDYQASDNTPYVMKVSHMVTGPDIFPSTFPALKN